VYLKSADLLPKYGSCEEERRRLCKEDHLPALLGLELDAGSGAACKKEMALIAREAK